MAQSPAYDSTPKNVYDLVKVGVELVTRSGLVLERIMEISLDQAKLSGKITLILQSMDVLQDDLREKPSLRQSMYATVDRNTTEVGILTRRSTKAASDIRSLIGNFSASQQVPFQFPSAGTLTMLGVQHHMEKLEQHLTKLLALSHLSVEQTLAIKHGVSKMLAVTQNNTAMAARAAEASDNCTLQALGAVDKIQSWWRESL